MSKIDTMNSKSNLDCIADELFTELTPQKGALVKGGLTFKLTGVSAIEADGEDTMYVKVGGTEIYRGTFSDGEIHDSLDIFIGINEGDKLELKEDLSFRLDGTGNTDIPDVGNWISTFSDSNKEYRVSYSVLP